MPIVHSCQWEREGREGGTYHVDELLLLPSVLLDVLDSLTDSLQMQLLDLLHPRDVGTGSNEAFSRRIDTRDVVERSELKEDPIALREAELAVLDGRATHSGLDGRVGFVEVFGEDRLAPAGERDVEGVTRDLVPARIGV